MFNKFLQGHLVKHCITSVDRW